MTLQMFKVDRKQQLQLLAFYQRAPRQFAVASGMYLNNLAFGTRDQAIETIQREMTVRSPAFVKRSIIVNRANFRQSLNSQRSEVGSIERPRFSGWIEQETGKKTKRKRAFLMEARGNQKKKRARPSARLKPSNTVLKPGDMGSASANVKNAHHRAQIFLSWTFRNKWRKPFMMSGHKRIKSGLYKWKGNKLRKLQTFTPRHIQPKKVRWLTLSRLRYTATLNNSNEWARVIDRTLR